MNMEIVISAKPHRLNRLKICIMRSINMSFSTGMSEKYLELSMCVYSVIIDKTEIYSSVISELLKPNSLGLNR